MNSKSVGETAAGNRGHSKNPHREAWRHQESGWKNYLIRFVQEDPKSGTIRVTIVGKKHRLALL